MWCIRQKDSTHKRGIVRKRNNQEKTNADARTDCTGFFHTVVFLSFFLVKVVHKSSL